MAGRDPELVVAELWGLGASGIEVRDDVLIAAFVCADDAQRARVRLAPHGTVRTVDPTAALHHRSGPEPAITVGSFVIRPSSLAAPVRAASAGTIELTIDPGHAFGSGSHASTRLALGLLAAGVEPGMRVADVGCGSGVLAIAAARLGASVVALDTDPAAVTATRANAERNEVAGAVRVVTGSPADIDGPFDLAVVNVTIDVHETIAARVRALEPSRVVGSGVLAGAQLTRLIAAYGGRAGPTIAEGEWAAVALDL